MEILTTTGIEKQFRGVKALKGVDFAVEAGEVHALMGENGAGKSTLIKIITGVYEPTAGKVVLNGEECRFRSPLDAERAGISTVYQEVNLLPDLSVAENVCIGREPRNRLGLIDKKAMRERARKALARLDIDIDVSESLSSYSIAVQQLVAIARALDVDCKLLILDEQTSSLDENEVKELFAVMKKLRDEGMAIIFWTKCTPSATASRFCGTARRSEHIRRRNLVAWRWLRRCSAKALRRMRRRRPRSVKRRKAAKSSWT